jgi:hypothetical protein
VARKSYFLQGPCFFGQRRLCLALCILSSLYGQDLETCYEDDVLSSLLRSSIFFGILSALLQLLHCNSHKSKLFNHRCVMQKMQTH